MTIFLNCKKPLVSEVLFTDIVVIHAESVIIFSISSEMQREGTSTTVE